MANVNRPSGFSPVEHLDGTPWNGQTRRFAILSTDTNAYYVGDLVIPVAGVDPVTNAGLVAKAASGATNLIGAITAIEPDRNNLFALNVPATKARTYYVYVATGSDTLYECTDDGLTPANLTGTAIGKNSDFTVAAPSGQSPLSASVLNSSTFATTATLPLKIVGLSLVPNNSAAPYARWLVALNNSVFRGGVAGV